MSSKWNIFCINLDEQFHGTSKNLLGGNGYIELRFFNRSKWETMNVKRLTNLILTYQHEVNRI